MPGFVPDNPPVRAQVKDEDGKMHDLQAPTGCDYRSLLMEGFKIVEGRLKAIEKVKARGLVPPIQIDGHMWLDDLISRRLDGTREGMRVKWELTDAIYYFDPTTGKVTRTAHARDDNDDN